MSLILRSLLLLIVLFVAWPTTAPAPTTTPASAPAGSALRVS